MMPSRSRILNHIVNACGLHRRRRFAARVQTAIWSGSGVRYIYSPEDFALRRPGTDHVVFLSNIFATCQNAPRRLQRQKIAGFVHSLVEANEPLPATFDQARAALMPVVRSMADWHVMQLSGQQDLAAAMGPPGIRIGEELGVWLVLDRPNSLSHLRASTLGSWDVDFATAFAAAEENLRACTARPFERRDDGVYAANWHDAYDSSRLLLPDLVRALPLDGEPVAMVPNRDWLLVADSAKPAALERLGALATEIFELPRPLSSVVLRLGPQGWETIKLDSARAELRWLVALQRGDLVGRYGEQKRLLGDLHLTTEGDAFVASVFQVDDPVAGSYTIAVWGNGARALLPRVDRIGFKDTPESPVQQVLWNEAASLAGSLMRPMGWFPERWLVEAYPEPAVIAQMAKV